MLQNFKHMPLILKLLTAHGLLCLMLLVFSIIPNESMSIDGKAVTYEQWWSSGAGVFASAVGLALPFSAWLILKKSTLARPVYLSSLVLTLVLPYLIFWQNYGSAIFGAVLVMLVAGYLYGKQSVVAYFGSNHAYMDSPPKQET